MQQNTAPAPARTADSLRALESMYRGAISALRFAKSAGSANSKRIALARAADALDAALPGHVELLRTLSAEGAPSAGLSSDDAEALRGVVHVYVPGGLTDLQDVILPIATARGRLVALTEAPGVYALIPAADLPL